MATAAPVAPRSSVEPLRQIGLYAATAITVGNIIGSGIFRSPHSVAQEIPGVLLPILAWVLGGVLSLCGSLALAELAVAHPRTGGLYVFIREAFGDAWGFVFGWANLWVIKPTVIAAIASVFALYFCEAVHLPPVTQLPIGCVAILVLTFVNWLGVREGAGTAALFTTLKLIGILGLCAVAFTLTATHAPGPLPEGSSGAGVGGASSPLLIAFISAMISVLFAYDGWTDVTYVGGECTKPSRNLPIAIVWGTALVIFVYVLTNLAYFRVLSADDVARYPAVGSETIGRLLGDWGRSALAVLVAVSTFGTVNGAVLTGPRVTQAMAADGLLWAPLAKLDPRRGSPALALWVQAVLSCVWLAVAGGFEDVSGWFVTTSWLFYGLAIAALFVQRRREGATGTRLAEYRTPLYPITAGLFILVTVALIASDLTASGWRAAAGVIIAALGFPVFLLWKGRGARTA
jgi:basic amino acid/polyamine antiporter, APA family